ncbi:MAG: pyrroline-5-carboxylate reductase [Clostridia bacterium]|nr:pyrroline-5-carboxylate reductase [Clostridia bacterium]
MYGFIGCGNMGGALATALAKANAPMLLNDANEEKAQALAEALGAQTGTLKDVAQTCGTVFLAVKPQQLPGVLEELKRELGMREILLVSMAAGVTIRTIEAILPLPIVRIMPNTPVSVGKGMILYDRNAHVSSEKLNALLSDMRFAGRWEFLSEALIDAACAVSGCGPAYFFMMLDALADGAVACGLPREKALLCAAATMEGAAALYLASNTHPGALKDAVCSPGGSTIAGVRVLEEQGFSGAVMDAVIAAYKRNQELGKH